MRAFFNRLVRRRRLYDVAFKQVAVRLVAEEEYSFKAAAEAVNVSEQSSRAWRRERIVADRHCVRRLSVS